VNPDTKSDPDESPVEDEGKLEAPLMSELLVEAILATSDPKVSPEVIVEDTREIIVAMGVAELDFVEAATATWLLELGG